MMLVNHTVFLLQLLAAFCVIDNKLYVAYGSKWSSSVWCSLDKLCTFQNLCYHPESHQFLFVLSELSVLQGLNESEINHLELSSIRSHNRMYMNLAIVSQVNELLSSAVFKNESVFLIHSFKRDNILHVIHDDLLPLFSTYLLLCGGDIASCVNKYRLTFVNGREPGPYESWYRVFSKRDPLLLSLLDYNSQIICYREVRIGLVRSSLWFDYGFSGVQGRLDNPKISGKDLRRFRDYVLSAMNFTPVANEGCAVFIKRTVNRRIVNEYFVKETITESIKSIRRKKITCLVELDLLRDSSETLLATVHQSDVFVGMHGAGMALAVFLPIGASILELFPFAIEPYNVSPIMAMSDLDGVGFHYAFWRNKNRSLSIPPSTTDPLGGSIAHLPIDHQNEILQLENVDAVPCCHDPAYLYYMFQDTVVSSDFTKTVLNALRHFEDFHVDDYIFDSYGSVKGRWMTPGPIYNVACKYNKDGSVEILWNEPVNSAEFDKLVYEVLAVAGEQPIFTGSVESTSFNTFTTENKIQLWICAQDVAGKLKSKDVFYECFNATPI